MKKIKTLTEGEFLKLFFAFFSAVFLIASVFMPDRSTMLADFWQILSQPSKLTCSYFATGGYAATFLNMGLVGFICLMLFVVLKGTPNNASTLAFILTLGFGSWGINILNVWPTVFGVMLYGLVKKEKFGGLVNAMLFSTGIEAADFALRIGNTATAVRLYSQALAASPTSVKAVQGLIDSLTKSGDIQAASVYRGYLRTLSRTK